MAVWTFSEFIEATGRVPFTDWVSSLPQDAQAHIAERLLAMEALQSWPDKWASRYIGYQSLIELRMPWNRVQYRPLGVYSKTHRRGFILLCGAIEKGNKIPSGDLNAADRRRKELLKEPSRVRAYTY
jgi:phage-related protein